MKKNEAILAPRVERPARRAARDRPRVRNQRQTGSVTPGIGLGHGTNVQYRGWSALCLERNKSVEPSCFMRFVRRGSSVLRTSVPVAYLVPGRYGVARPYSTQTHQSPCDVVFRHFAS